jgi:hypothetical protein
MHGTFPPRHYTSSCRVYSAQEEVYLLHSKVLFGDEPHEYHTFYTKTNIRLSECLTENFMRVQLHGKPFPPV